MTSEVPICARCRWHALGHLCTHPNYLWVGRVTGQRYYQLCAFARDYKSDCGPDGKLYEPKRSLFRWLRSL